jgi:ATP-dependent RNA helicase DHX36
VTEILQPKDKIDYRVQPGICYHLFSERREMALANYPVPEMLRSRLEEVVLQVKILQQGLVSPFLSKVMQPPDPRAIDNSLKVLRHMRSSYVVCLKGNF